MLETDQNFVKKTWINNYQRSQFAIKINPAIYKKYQSVLIENAIGDSYVLIAAHNEIEDEILGFVVVEPLQHICCVHYLFVKKSYRKFGIGTELMRQASLLCEDKALFYSADTAYSHFLRRFDAKYNPYLMLLRI